MISIIIPYWNAEDHIARCVDSLRQEGNFEFILVNDKSKDNGETIAREHAEGDSRFVFINNKHKKGVSGARNTGLDIAQGEWITFLDADDELLPDAWLTFSAVIKADRNANVHQLNHLRYYPSKDRIKMKYANHEGTYETEHLPNCWWGVWNKLCKAEFVKDIRFDESLNYGEDGLFVLECLVKDKRIHHGTRRQTAVKHILGNPNSLSHIKSDKDVLKQIHTYEKFMLKQNDSLIKAVVCEEIQKLWKRMEKFYR